MLDNNLKSDIDKLWDKFWSSGISNPLTAIEQMSYLIFMKRLEDEENNKILNSQLTGEEYHSLFENKEDCMWSNWINMSSDKMFKHVKDTVFPFLIELSEDDSSYARYMKDSIFQIPTPSLLAEATSIIEDLEIKEPNKDTQGDLYEYLLSQLSTAGRNGQFRTPRHIIKMMIDIINPKIGDKIWDPACGTAGFLINAYNHILKENTSKELIKIDKNGNEYDFKGDKLSSEEYDILNKHTFYGNDFDLTMIKIGLMNLMMHGIKNPNLEQINSLSTQFSQNPEYNIILANPPFRGSIDKDEINVNFSINSTKTELLFLELMYNCLTIGGKCAVIVPEGVLFGTSNAHKKLRKKILTNCRLDMIISMPSGVFKPYAGVSTAILIFTKGEATENILFYEMKSDGFTLDDKREFIDGKGDIPDIIDKYKHAKELNLNDRKKQSFIVPVSEIIENDYILDLSSYKELIYEEKEYEDPETIKDKIIELEEEIIDGLRKLNI